MQLRASTQGKMRKVKEKKLHKFISLIGAVLEVAIGFKTAKEQKTQKWN